MSTGAGTDPRLDALRQGMAGAYWARAKPDEAAIVSARGRRTFSELNARANQLARALRHGGLEPGDGVALLCSNRPEFAEALTATQRSGMRLTPINWHLTAREVAYILTDCEARAFLADERFVETAAAAASGAPDLCLKLVIGGEKEGFGSYEEALAGEDPEDIADPLPGGTMLYTSGTTGLPKGVRRPPGAALAAAGRSARLPRELAEAARAGPHLCTGPLYHAAPLAFSLSLPLSQGSGVVLMDGWEAEETLRLVDRHRIGSVHMVPTMFHRLLSIPAEVRRSFDLSSLRFVVHGAASCPVPVKQAMIEWLGPIVYEYYAATEGTGTWVGPEEWLRRPGTVGRSPAPGHIRILDDTGRDLPAGGVGEVYIAAPAAARFEYHRDAEKTARAYRGDHFTLGDLGYLDEDGYLYLTDRSADLIVSGGVNIYPAEVEEALVTHPAVGDVAVIGVPDEEWGESVKAVVELKPGVEPGPALAGELISWCRGTLAGYKCPRSVDFSEGLPREDNGKLYRRLVRERYR
jgi:long-chain acyl-CoA synthetase